MPEINGLEWTFDTVSSTYEKFQMEKEDSEKEGIFIYCQAIE